MHGAHCISPPNYGATRAPHQTLSVPLEKPHTFKKSSVVVQKEFTLLHFTLRPSSPDQLLPSHCTPLKGALDSPLCTSESGHSVDYTGCFKLLCDPQFVAFRFVYEA
ncbi:hypothetical protein TNCV_1621271 [Trichonephila clavipes]|nr:hypothetical protein TNCV_1621271 [Trichonephila clavipes]